MFSTCDNSQQGNSSEVSEDCTPAPCTPPVVGNRHRVSGEKLLLAISLIEADPNCPAWQLIGETAISDDSIRRLKAVVSCKDSTILARLKNGELTLTAAYKLTLTPEQLKAHLQRPKRRRRAVDRTSKETAATNGEDWPDWPEDDWQCVRLKAFGLMKDFYNKHPEARGCIVTDLSKLSSELQRKHKTGELQ